MGIIDRLGRLISANLNDVMDRAEDPEKMLDQILRDMQANMTSGRAQVAAMIAQEKELEADLEETRQLAMEWAQKAQRAVQAGKDDLAREALRRKRDNDENAQVYAQQLQAQQGMVEKLKTQLRQLESKYQATLSQRDAMIARQRRARAQQQVSQSVASFSPLDPTTELNRMERRIRGAEARAAAVTELEDESFDAQFRELDMDADIEAELEALRTGAAPVALPAERPATALGTGDATVTPEQPVSESSSPT